jgi:hypothetical protein
MKYELADLKPRIVASLAFITFLLYPGLANRIVTVYKCRLIGGKDYLVADYSVVCWEGAHMQMVVANFFFLGAYVIGMPLIMFLAMYMNRETIKSDPKNEHMLKMYGSMYKAYEPDYWFFEILEMMRKLVLTAGLVLVSPGSTAQIFLGILVCFFYCCATMNMKPLLDDNDDYLSQAASVQLFMTLLTGLVLKVDVSSEGRYEQMVVGGLLIFMNVAIIGMGLGVLGKTFVDGQLKQLEAQKEKAGKCVKFMKVLNGLIFEKGKKHSSKVSVEFAEMDTDNNKLVDRAEYYANKRKVVNEKTGEVTWVNKSDGATAKRFSVVDKNNDGFLTKEELEDGNRFKTKADGSISNQKVM